MKHSKLISILAICALGVFLAVTIVGCADSSTHTTGQDSSNTAIEEQSQLQDINTEAPQERADSESEPSENTQIGEDNQQGGSTNPGQGGVGGGLDTMPGQTNDKGYTANDNGLAISKTLSPSEAFTERDLDQNPDTSDATKLGLVNNKDLSITKEGTYIISGTSAESTIMVDAGDNDKVQLVLDNVSIANTNFPAIYVKNADKVFITLVGDNSLAVSDAFTADGDTQTDAVIFSKDDLCFNGTGSLTISSSEHAIVSKDDLKITGGTYTLGAENGSALRANDSVRIANGSITISAEDGIKAKNDEDNELGYVYIQNGDFIINTTDNGIVGYAFVWIDGGTFSITSEECIEGTYVQINGGDLNLASSDDGINASIKSSVYTPTIDITGGDIAITMEQGDTDALDSNGYIYISGGTININAQFAFDYAWGAELRGGSVYVNGEQISEITESMAGGFGGPGGMGGFGGGPRDGQAPDEPQGTEGFGGPQGGMQDGFQGDRRPENWNGEEPPELPQGEMDGRTPPDWGNGERPERPQRQ